MDFFGAQDKARARTKQLVALYFGAMLAITVCIYFVFVLAGFGADAVKSSQGSGYSASTTNGDRTLDLINPGLFLSVAGGVVLVIAGASLYKISTLGKGGAAIAKSVGGRQIDMSTRDPDERKLMNIVEEMSIASGAPMPDVFILEGEDSINAFAAGSDLNDAAVAVTKGAIRQLSRDELQGVIAHEFSHIFSGDMRLNIRLIGPLFGLLVIAFIGRMFLYSGSGRSRGKDQGNLALVGLAIMIIGYIGVIFGRLIQAAISRQREYLADAAAVQFTRNPEGIGNALRRLGYAPNASNIKHAHAEDTAHMFFAQALGSSLSTHPPLPKRIRAVLPSWDGTFLAPKKRETEEKSPESSTRARSSSTGGAFSAATAMAAVGAMSEDHLRAGIERRIRVRERLGETPLDQPEEAKSTFAALILSEEEATLARQVAILAAERGEDFGEKATSRYRSMLGLSASDRFAVMELCYPGLRKLGKSESSEFSKILRKLANEDGKLSLREALVLEVASRQLGTAKDSKANTQRLENNVAKFADPISKLLGLVASLDSPETESAKREFEDAISEQYLLSSMIRFPEKGASLNELPEILAKMDRASFGIRKQVLAAAAKIILADNETSDREWTFLRLVSLTMGVPMPALAES